MQRKRIGPPRRTVNHVIKQAEISQIRDPGRGITKAGWNSPDRPQRVEIHGGAVCRRRGQHLREPAEASADGADVRRSCLDTSLNHEIVEVPGTVGTYHSNEFNSSIAKVHEAQFREETHPRDHAETGSGDPEGVGKQVFGPKMNKAEAHLNRVGSSADSVHRRVVKPWAERSTSREESAGKEKDS